MGKILSKKYRIIHTDGKLIMPLEESVEKTETYVGDHLECFETDSLEKAEQYIKDNNLSYEYL